MSVLKKLFLLPLSWVYGLVVFIRNWLYDIGFYPVKKLSQPVISIGNITAGGTGKSPTVLFLAKRLLELKRNPAIISRGYKRESEEKIIIEDTSDSQQVDWKEMHRLYGDEPVMMKFMCPNMPIAVHANRVKAAEELERSGIKANIFLLDDAFQHRRIHRNLDIVLLDATKPLSEYKLLPLGFAREPVGKGLGRASVIFLTKVNLTDSMHLNRTKAWLEQQISSSVPVFEMTFTIQKFRSLDGRQFRNCNEFTSKNVVLASGLANPVAFEESVSRAIESQVKKHFSYVDHHFYSQKDIDDIIGFCERENVTEIIVSQKDAVKLMGYDFFKTEVEVWVSDLCLQCKNKDDGEKVDELLKKVLF